MQEWDLTHPAFLWTLSITAEVWGLSTSLHRSNVYSFTSARAPAVVCHHWWMARWATSAFRAVKKWPAVNAQDPVSVWTAVSLWGVEPHFEVLFSVFSLLSLAHGPDAKMDMTESPIVWSLWWNVVEMEGFQDQVVGALQLAPLFLGILPRKPWISMNEVWPHPVACPDHWSQVCTASMPRHQLPTWSHLGYTTEFRREPGWYYVELEKLPGQAYQMPDRQDEVL